MGEDLLRPGDHRAGSAWSSAAVIRALVRVEAAWATGLEAHALVPVGTAAALATYLPTPAELAALAVEAEAGGNPLIPLLARLRVHAEDRVAGSGDRIHTGLTSQDVIDSALMLLSAESADSVLEHLAGQQAALADLAHAHRSTPLLARSLGQPAQATTFGVRVIGWRDDIVAAHTALGAWRKHVPAQLGGAVGDLAVAATALGEAGTARELARMTAERLGLAPSRPWHTSRSPVTRLGDALVTATDAWGHLANDMVALAATHEAGEPLAPGRGSSSAMAHKTNPVLSILLRRTAASTPLLAAQLHLAAAASTEERSAGPWHTEWPALRSLARQALAAADQASELVTGVRVDPVRMKQVLASADVPAPDLTAAGLLVDAALEER